MSEWVLKLLSIGDYAEYRTLGGQRSGLWPHVRNNFLVLNSSCAVCGKKEELEVHHKVPFHEKPELELDPQNLITFCGDHHFLFGHLLNWSSYNPEVEVDARIYHDKIKLRP
jgi:5-methylcytosine-specific restriction protein A